MQIVPIRENWADLTGRILSIEPAQGGFMRIQLVLESASDVQDVPNLLMEHVGNVITLDIPNNYEEVSAGDLIAARARLVRSGFAVATCSSRIS